MTKKRPVTTDAGEIIFRRFFEGRPDRLRALEEERINDEISRQLCELRTRLGLTQQQLAHKLGTTASVISKIENYE